MKVALKALGCRLNEAELQKWSRDFLARGHTMTQEIEQADLIVLNTCAVTSEAVKKSRQLIRRSQKSNPKAKLVVSGCYSSLEPESTQAIEGVDLLVNNTNKEHLVDIASRELELANMPSTATIAGENALFTANKSRAFIKIQDGCRYRCTFCIVTVARGAEQSRSEKSIIEEVQTAHEHGVQEVILTGVHAGGYGSDSHSSLTQLILQIIQQTDIPRIRMGSLEPWDLDDDFIALFKNERFMPHLHLPLQSGSNRVLRRMARRCKKEDFKIQVDTLRKEVTDFQVSTDIIVGFPGETDEEFQASRDFIESMNFSHVHIFSYSPRKGTKAASLADPIDPTIKRARSRELHDLAFRLKKGILMNHVNREFSVLWETAQVNEHNGMLEFQGYTPNFLRVQTLVKPTVDLQQQIRMAKVTGLTDDHKQLTATV